MKVGILSFTEGYNYGNKLQNYALLTYLQNNFPCEVKTVDNCVAQGSRFEKARILLTWAFPSAKHYMYWKRLLRFKSFVSAKYSCGFSIFLVSSIIVDERYLDYFTTITEDRL